MMKHELTEERCLVLHRNGEPCRRCSRCGQWIGAVFSPDSDCPGPPAAVAPEAREPDPDEVRQALARYDRGFEYTAVAVDRLARAARAWLREREQPQPSDYRLGVILGEIDQALSQDGEFVRVARTPLRVLRDIAVAQPQPAPALSIEQVIEACAAAYGTSLGDCIRVYAGADGYREGGKAEIVVHKRVHVDGIMVGYDDTPEAAIQALGAQAVKRLEQQRDQAAALKKLGK